MIHPTSNLTGRVILLTAFLFSLTSCPGGTDQLHGMMDVNFSSTAVCNAQEKLIQFHNASDEDLVIKGVTISEGTDPLGNFSLSGVLIGSEEKKSINGVLENIVVPPGVSYAFQISYLPKTENAAHEAILDIAYQSPKEGILQATLQGTSVSKFGDCGTGQTKGPVGGFDGKMVLTIQSMIAATSAIRAPINTNQGQQEFVPVEIPVTLNASLGTITLAPLTKGFILPPPRDDIPGLAGIIRGPTVVTIPNPGSGTYNVQTGSMTIPNILIHMDGKIDFAADLAITLTTDRVDTEGLSPKVNVQGLQQLGTPSHWDSATKEAFGTPVRSDTGEVRFVGTTRIENVVLVKGSNPSLQSLPGATMAVLIEGTLKEAL